MYTIVVCCGAACATSSLLEAEVKEFLERNHLEGTVHKCMISQIDRFIKDTKADLIIPSGKYTFDTDIPVISGMPYITGIGKEAMEARMLEALKEKD